MDSNNPVLSRIGSDSVDAQEGVMTVKGTVDRAAILLALVVASATIVWKVTGGGESPNLWAWALFGAIGGLIVGLITIFNPRGAWFLAPVYALIEGIAVGAVSAFYEMAYPGLVIRAVFLTFSIMVAMLMLYRSGVIRVTDGFVRGLVAATGGVLLFYVGAMLLNAFGGVQVAYLHTGGWAGILIGLVVIVIASLNLVLDFAVIEDGVRRQAARRYEWYAAFGLIVTLVWLYFELLRWLGILNRD